MQKVKTISEYIKGQSGEVTKRLKTINELITKLAPKAVSTISYGMPAYKLNGKVLIYFAAFKNHVSIYPFPSTLEVFKKQTSNYKTSKGTIQFQNNEKLPIGLIIKIIRFRINEITRKV